MRQITQYVGVLLLGMVFFTLPAKADLVSVSVDVPLSYSLSNSSEELKIDEISGYKFGVNLPLLPGLAYENYTITTKKRSGVFTTIELVLYDIYVDLPTPFINISLGAGYGTAELFLNQPAASTPIGDGKVSQVFVELGWPVLGVADIHLGYHQLSGDVKLTAGGEASLDGTLTTAGIKIGF